MNQSISITIISPFVTIEKFHEISGLPVATIRGKIRNGEIQIKKKENKNDKVLINMVSLTQEAMNI